MKKIRGILYSFAPDIGYTATFSPFFEPGEEYARGKINDIAYPSQRLTWKDRLW